MPAGRSGSKPGSGQAYKGIVAYFEVFFAGELDAADVRALATPTMAAADGLFIAHEVDPARVDLDDPFQPLARALLGAAQARTRA